MNTGFLQSNNDGHESWCSTRLTCLVDHRGGEPCPGFQCSCKQSKPTLESRVKSLEAQMTALKSALEPRRPTACGDFFTMVGGLKMCAVHGRRVLTARQCLASDEPCSQHDHTKT